MIKTSGIVLRTTKYGETSLIITLLTRDFGRISAIANNVRQKRSRMLAGLQLFAYSEVVMYQAKSKNGLYRIDEMNVIEGFDGLRMDLDKMAYATYFADITACTASEDVPENEMLRLLLNTLYAVDKQLCHLEKIKTVFEWRIAAIAGYTPQTVSCGVCGCKENIFGLSLADGTVFCKECMGERQGVAELTEGMRRIIEYITSVECKRVFSFEASETTIKYLSEVSERYISLQLDKEFKTLDYLKKIRALGETEDEE